MPAIAPMTIGTGLPSQNNMMDTTHQTPIMPATGCSLRKMRNLYQAAERQPWHVKLAKRGDLVYLIYLVYLVSWFVWLILFFEPNQLAGH
jgi:hypothetical protein